MEKVSVERDQYGMWVHPDLPHWGEGTTTEQAKAWFAERGLTYHVVMMDGDLGEEWASGEIDSCANWQPQPEVSDSFLVGIWDTEDGVLAFFASPIQSS